MQNAPKGDRILVVDDEETIRHVVRSTLEDMGWIVMTAESAEEALEIVEGFAPHVGLLDIVLPRTSGIQLLGEIKRVSPDTEVVMMTSHASIETAVQAIRKGAYDYLNKPFEDLEEVTLVVKRAIERRKFLVKNRELRDEQERRNAVLSSAVMRMSSLIDAGRAMGSYRSLPELLDYFIGLVARELDVERASLMALDEESATLRIVASRGLEGVDVDDVRVPLGEGVAGSVASSGQPFLVADAGSDPRLGDGVNPKLSDSFISAPIVLSIAIKSREKVLGVINVTNRRSGRRFDAEDLSYLSGLAGQLAVAIEATQHFDALQEAYDSLREAQSQLVVSERIKAIGQIATGVAHDFNNALSVVLAKAEVMLDKLDRTPDDRESLRRDLNTIRKVSLQGATTIRRIQDYTRVRKDRPDDRVDLNGVVRDAVEMTRPKWKAECEGLSIPIAVEFHLSEVPPISGNPYELTQVVGNLIFNAVEAMPTGGRLSFRTYVEGKVAMLEVADTGVGIREQDRARLFEPFFTTKATGQGLGTSIVYGIVARHGGEISVDSRAGCGTTFRVSLPIHSGPTRAAQGPAVERPEAVPGRILLVEDDDAVRETFEDALSRSGHRVLAFPGGVQAMAAFRPDAFDLVITDLSMPGMTGLELAQKLRALDPGIPIMLLSGFAVQQDADRVRQAGINRVLAKPCPLEQLMLAVSEEMRLPTPA